METVLTKVADEKAPHEMKRFTIIGCAVSIISLVIFWWLGIIGIAFCIRGLLLTWHKANTGSNKLLAFRVSAVIGILAGMISLVFGIQL